MSDVAVHLTEPREPASSTAVPLVLLHAFPLDSRMWDAVVARLPAVQVVRVDAPGFGGSAAADPGLDGFALAVVAAVRELGAEQAVVAGLSMGGYAAMAIAEVAPGLLAGLGLLSTKASADADEAREKRLQMVSAVEAGATKAAAPMLKALVGETTRASRPDVVATVDQWLRAAPRDGLVWAQRSMAARPDRIDVLRGLPDGLPALVLRGTEDDLMSATDAEAMAEALRVEVTRVAEAGHLAAVERPEPVAEALAELYRRATA